MSDSNNSSHSNVVVVDSSALCQKAPLSADIKGLSEKKRHVFQEWLKEGVVAVLLDATSEGVKVPTAYASERNLVLNFSYDFHVPDFNFNEVGVWATLSFDSGDHFCQVPWNSVLGMQCQALERSARWFVDFQDALIEAEPEHHPSKLESPNFDNKGTVIEFDFSNNKAF